MQLYKGFGIVYQRGMSDGLAKWRSIAADGPPAPEVLVLCWDGRETFVEWFGSKPDAGRGVTHWTPYEMPPGAESDMHDGRRALGEPSAESLREIPEVTDWKNATRGRFVSF